MPRFSLAAAKNLGKGVAEVPPRTNNCIPGAPVSTWWTFTVHRHPADRGRTNDRYTRAN